MFATPRRMLQLAPNQYIYNHISKHIYKYTYIYICIYGYASNGKHQTTKHKQNQTKAANDKWFTKCTNWICTQSWSFSFICFLVVLRREGFKVPMDLSFKVHMFTMPKWMALQVRRKLFSTMATGVTTLSNTFIHVSQSPCPQPKHNVKS